MTSFFKNLPRSMINCSLGFQRLIYSSSQVCDRDSEDSEEFEEVFDDETSVRNFTASRLENNVGGKCFFYLIFNKTFFCKSKFYLIMFRYKFDI